MLPTPDQECSSSRARTPYYRLEIGICWPSVNNKYCRSPQRWKSNAAGIPLQPYWVSSVLASHCHTANCHFPMMLARVLAFKCASSGRKILLVYGITDALYVPDTTHAPFSSYSNHTTSFIHQFLTCEWFWYLKYLSRYRVLVAAGRRGATPSGSWLPQTAPDLCRWRKSAGALNHPHEKKR